MNYYKFGLMTLLPLMLMSEWFRRLSADSLTARTPAGVAPVPRSQTEVIPPEEKPGASSRKEAPAQLPPVTATTPAPLSASLNEDDIKAWREQAEQQAMRIALLEEQLARATGAAAEAVAAKAALSLQLEQQSLRIAQLEQELATMQGVAAIGDTILNKWRYRNFSR